MYCYKKEARDKKQQDQEQEKYCMKCDKAGVNNGMRTKVHFSERMWNEDFKNQSHRRCLKHAIQSGKHHKRSRKRY